MFRMRTPENGASCKSGFRAYLGSQTKVGYYDLVAIQQEIPWLYVSVELVARVELLDAVDHLQNHMFLRFERLRDRRCIFEQVAIIVVLHHEIRWVMVKVVINDPDDLRVSLE